ncbi:hypothetical protein BD311DRAFT_414724 [Dichomitus squalens]|uniref:Uncharacterized protein n=1 Tax=Dichomitus squalens TaxID=114155 RepID=A0A4Q9MIR6_9APHY|nr:hypothetical protein BD311DRAFT_414724 [Dichomitus squalens]
MIEGIHIDTNMSGRPKQPLGRNAGNGSPESPESPLTCTTSTSKTHLPRFFMHRWRNCPATLNKSISQTATRLRLDLGEADAVVGSYASCSLRRLGSCGWLGMSTGPAVDVRYVSTRQFSSESRGKRDCRERESAARQDQDADDIVRGDWGSRGRMRTASCDGVRGQKIQV